MSLADIAQCESVRVAGDDLDEAIINHMKKAYNLMIGEQTAEKIKIQIGSAAPDGDETNMEVRGRDMISGLPRKTVITSEEIREALQEPLSSIIETVTRTLERCEPEVGRRPCGQRHCSCRRRGLAPRHRRGDFQCHRPGLPHR